jgi:hypothetical protein
MAMAVAVESGFECPQGMLAARHSWMACSSAEQELGLTHRTTGIHVDLHWRLGPRFEADSLPAEDLFSRSVEIWVLGRRIRALGPADVALAHSVHAATHEWSKVDDIAVMAAVLAALRPPDVALLQHLAAKYGCRRRLNIGVLLASTMAAADVPGPLLEVARADNVAKDLAAEAGALLLCTRVVERNAARGYAAGVLWQARALDCLLDTVSHLTRRLLTPGARDWDSEVGPPLGGAGGVLAGVRLQLRRQRRLWAMYR